jgi:hypothetical protein
MTDVPAAVEAWHAIASSLDPSGLDALLADDVVFRSPAVHTPQAGKAITTAYLTGALHVLGPTLRYVEQWYGPRSAVLEFECDLDGTVVHGVDMLRWDDDDRLVEFTVMVRPYKGLQALMPRMAAELEQVRD